jgi:predicted AlkP superfamily phosphohydrolase/phosphomutase
MAADARRLLIVGLELGDGNLIRGWTAAGLLPTFGRLFERGCWGWLETTADDLHISAWPSLYTGVPPGEHGVYFTFQPAPGVQGYRRFHEGIYGQPTFWRMLDAHGVRCIAFDPPYSHAEPGFGGCFIHDWGTWAHYLAPGSRPDDLLPELEKSCGRYPLGLEANDIGFRHIDADDMSRRLEKSIAVKARAVGWLMQSRPWDVTFAVFGETHAAGHYCWSSALKGDASDGSTDMFRVYAAVDRALSDLQRVAGPETTLMVVSGDRCGPNFAGWHLLPEILARLGYAGGPGTQADAPETSRPRARFDPVKALRDLLPKDFRKQLARKLPTALRDKLAQRVDTADIDWARTRAYCLPTDLEGYIRINLRGREPSGIVEPGDEYARVLRDIDSALAELRDPGTGRRIVRKVIAADDAFPGDRRPLLPDLIVQWESAGPITGATSSRIGELRGDSPDPRTGTHRGPGFVVAAGLAVPAGVTMENASILDLAPTVLRRMRSPVPESMRGRAWRELSDV